MPAPAPATLLLPEDCVFWAPAELDGLVLYESRGSDTPQLAATSKGRWCRNIMLRPLDGLPRVIEDFADRAPDAALTYFMTGGVILCITPENATEPLRRRFRDLGPRAVFSLHSGDRVSQVECPAMLEGLPYMEGAIIIVTWNRRFPLEFRRHIAALPALTINWSRRK